MSSICCTGNCHCEEKDKQILYFKSQIDQLRSKKLILRATNLQLRDQLDDCTQDLKAQLTHKEDEVEALRQICKTMSSRVLFCQEKAIALQEELVKKEELLRVASTSFTLSSDCKTPRSPVSPRSVHNISIQTSPHREDLRRAESCISEDFFRPVSGESDTAPSFEEVQELRYTVQVLKEQLEELHSTPTSPNYAPDQMRCASLADMLGCGTSLRLELPVNIQLNSGCNSPTVSPMKPPPSPLTRQSSYTMMEGCQSLECQVLHTLLVSELDTAEGTKRQAISLEHEGALCELQMMHDCFLAQHRLLLGGLRDLQQLEACERGRLVQAEKIYRSVLSEEKDESPPQAAVTIQPPCPSVEHEALSATLEPHALSCEAMGRTAIALEEECSRRALTMYDNWHQAQSRLHLAALVQMAMLEGAERDHIVQAEGVSWSNLLLDDLEPPQTFQVMSSVASSVGEDFSFQSEASMEDLWAMWQHSAVQIEAEETQTRDALGELFCVTLLECLRCVARRRCSRKLCEMWENERWTPVAGWGKALLGRPPFSDSTGKMALNLSVFDSLIAWDDLCWSSDGWELDISSSVDPNGWQYALTFHTPFLPSPRLWALVRRRKWVRACEPLPAAKPADVAQELPIIFISMLAYRDLVIANFV
eukprot:GGOE01010282.1.p1 GENE.GGOE01010282.1~~GGOE01010282.1.p1  ORF type:complete len:649 (-),score=142.49 GGOE01010282.1:625-2571(-)